MRPLARDAQNQVLVIGAGSVPPISRGRAGRAAARGPPVVEREPKPHRKARATALQAGTLEILARQGSSTGRSPRRSSWDAPRVFDADQQRRLSRSVG
jgi:hypothetical protein